MPDIDRESLRKLADWAAHGAPVSSLYLDVDGRKFPRRQDCVVRAEQLCHELHRMSRERDLPRVAAGSVERDAAQMMEFVRGLERGSTRGVAMFSCSDAKLWDAVTVPRPLKDRVVLAQRPYVIPLEALVEMYESFCTVLVDREKARIFLVRIGQVQERTDVLDDVPGQHDQGGWAQARFQRHIDDHAAHHLKHVGDVLLRFWKAHRFDRLILAGPHEVVADFERYLHTYLRQRVVARVSLAMTALAAEVLERSLAVEEEIEGRRERDVLERLLAEAAAGRQAVLGLEAVLSALNDARVDTLVIPFGLSVEGVRCASCGRLAGAGSACGVCGGRMERDPDVVDSAVAAALRQRYRVETLSMAMEPQPEQPAQQIGALLRY